MQALDPLKDVPPRLWRMVALAKHRLLMLDYDGTIAPFSAARLDARPLPGALELLKQIAASPRTSVAIISGRPLTEVDQLIGTFPAIFVGEHGWERRSADGDIVRRPLDPSVAETIEVAERMARNAGWSDWLERKRSAVVLHTRGLPAALAGELECRCIEAWRPLAGRGHVTIDCISGGVELRARGRNKGTAVLSLFSQSPPGTLGVFVGDDVTDEDAFAAVRDCGFGVRVGDSPRPSVAQGRLASIGLVPEFLAEWLRITVESET